jgi:hypothetical protein
MRTTIVPQGKKLRSATITALLIASGCGSNTSGTNADLYRLPTQADVDQDRLRWDCVSREVTMLVNNPGPDKVDPYNETAIGDLALQRCPSKSSYVFLGQSLDRIRANTLATEAGTARMQAESEEIRKRDTKQAAENEAALKAAAPIARDKWGSCLRASVKGLALTTMEPAATVVTIAIAACKPQWQELEQLHARYGDPVSANALLEVERQITGPLMLQVEAARAASQATSPQRQARHSDGPI